MAVADSGAGRFERLYARLGPRYLDLLLLGAALSIGAAAAATFPLALGYLPLDPEHFVRRTVVMGAYMTVVVGPLAELVVTRRLGALRRWLHAPDAAGALEAWHDAVDRLPGTVQRGALVVLAGSVPAAVIVTHDQGQLAILAGVLTGWTVVTAGGVVHFLVWERALRPVVLDVAAMLPSDFTPPRRSLSLSGRILILLPVMNVVTALVATALVPADADPAARFAAVVTASAVVTLLISAPLTMMLRRSMMQPLHELLAAMRRVENGELDRGLPIVAADEMAAIAEHFNSMLEGLRERARLVLELQASRARIVAAADAARRRIEADLHDGAQQHLIIARIKAGAMAKRLAGDPELAAMGEDLAAGITTALEELRRLAHGLYPPVLQSDGLAQALREAGRRSAPSVRVECEDLGRYGSEIEAAVYFCCLEALQNAGKHAGEDANVVVGLTERDGRLEFSVSDDGPGFDPLAGESGAGVQNMADRVGALGGTFTLRSAPGQGTTASGRVPVA